MQTKNGARHGFSLLYRVRASPIHTHPPTHALFASWCPLFFVCFLSLSKPLVVLYVLLSLLWCGGMRNAFVIRPPLVMLMVMAVCVCCFGVANHSGLCFPDRLMLVMLCCSCTPHKHSTKKAEQLKKFGKPARKPSIFAHRLFRMPCPQCPGLFSRRKLAEKGLDLLMMCFLTASHFTFRFGKTRTRGGMRTLSNVQSLFSKIDCAIIAWSFWAL